MNRQQRRALAKQKPANTGRMMANIGRIMERDHHENARFSGEHSWKMIMAAVGLTMHERGKSDEKIGNFLIEVQALIDREIDNGEDAVSLVKKLEEQTGIVLRMKE